MTPAMEGENKQWESIAYVFSTHVSSKKWLGIID
jgi:hypothetical protein